MRTVVIYVRLHRIYEQGLGHETRNESTYNPRSDPEQATSTRSRTRTRIGGWTRRVRRVGGKSGLTCLLFRSQIFLRESQHRILQARLHLEIDNKVKLIQRWVRGVLQRRQFLQQRDAAVTIQVGGVGNATSRGVRWGLGWKGRGSASRTHTNLFIYATWSSLTISRPFSADPKFAKSSPNRAGQRLVSRPPGENTPRGDCTWSSCGGLCSCSVTSGVGWLA